MPNHDHLRVLAPRANLGRAMQHLGSAFTTGLHRLHRGGEGPVFRGRFLTRLVEDEARWTHHRADVDEKARPPALAAG